MAWNQNVELFGHEVTLFGWGKTVSIQIDSHDIYVIGKDMHKVFKWLNENGRELGLVEFWREAHYDKEYFDRDELRIIYDSKFSSDEDRRTALNALNGIREPKPEQPQRQKCVNHGHVYLIRSGNTYKIGKAKNVDFRVTSISPVLPYPVELIHSIELDGYDTLESELHQRFAGKRLNGEWFSLDDADVEYIKGIT
jgi:hypothetical protein